MDNDFQARQQKNLNYFNSCLSTFSSTVFSNEESLKKIESNLNIMTQTVSKFNHKLVIQKEIYSTNQKDISSCISTIASHDQNNKVIHSCFGEKLNKAIHDTKQVAMKLSEAPNKAPALQFYVPDSRIDNINKPLHDHDKEIQTLMNKIAIYSQKKGYFAGTHPTVPNCNDTT
eukprot:9627248-Ditylum_brightwellii.AAC.1